MAKKFLTPIDLNKNELQNARVQNLASAPSSPVSGQIYYDTVALKLYWYNGTTWVDATGGTFPSFATPTIALGSAAAAGSAGTVIRSDATIAAFDATNPTTQAYGDTPVVGAAAFAANRAHKHGMPTHVAADHSAIKVSDLAAPSADVAFAGFKITGLGTPTLTGDAATKGYVDAAAAGIDWKASVRAATTAAGTLASSFANGSVIDGVTLATGDRILIKNQAAGAENGIYVVAASGAPARATDADVAAEITAGMAVFVEEGTTNADTGWLLTNDGAIVVGTTALVFVQFTSLGQITAGAGLTKTGNSLDVIAGTGIVVAADSVAVDRTGTNGSHVPLKYAADIGDGATTAITVTHNLGTKDVQVTVFDNTTPFNEVICDVAHTSTSALTLTFVTAPTSGQYRVVVIG